MLLRPDLRDWVAADCMYILKNPDTIGAYTLRLHATPLNGDCAALIQHHAALAPDGYSKQCAPGTGANRSKQTPVKTTSQAGQSEGAQALIKRLIPAQSANFICESIPAATRKDI